MGAEIAWERFHPLMEQVHEKERKCPAGRKPFDVLLMFKVLILQTLYNLADEAVEYQIRDRLSFMPFLGLEMYGSVPGGTKVWQFRERLKALALIERLFDRFDDYLAQAGFGWVGAPNTAERRPDTPCTADITNRPKRHIVVHTPQRTHRRSPLALRNHTSSGQQSLASFLRRYALTEPYQPTGAQAHPTALAQMGDPHAADRNDLA